MSLLARAIAGFTRKEVSRCTQPRLDDTHYGAKEPKRVLDKIAQALGAEVHFFPKDSPTHLIVPPRVLVDSLNTVRLIPLPEDFFPETDEVSVRRLFDPKRFATPPKVDFLVERETSLNEARRILNSLNDGSPERLALIRDSERILAMLFEHHPETVQHSVRVTRLATAHAINSGYRGKELEARIAGALMHDEGKLLVPKETLNAKKGLTDEQKLRIRLHPVAGHNMAVHTRSMVNQIKLWQILGHHMREDGSPLGYPSRPKGMEIPQEARELHIPDVDEALTGERSYRPIPATARTSAKYILRKIGTEFHPQTTIDYVRFRGFDPEELRREIALDEYVLRGLVDGIDVEYKRPEVSRIAKENEYWLDELTAPAA